jgi:Ser/Thr protein kinase RdoA (MazF antagonist)
VTPASTSTSAAAAADAAVRVAAGLGIAGAEPEILADGANVLVLLRPSPVVAKVAASTRAVRPDGAAWLQRELDLAAFLAGAGAPVLAPSPEVPAVAHRGAGQVMSFWTYVPPAGAGPPDAATLGSMLRDLHPVLRSYPGTVPKMAPLGDIPAFLARPESQVSAAQAAALAAAFARLSAQLESAQLESAAGGGQVLHGDAGAGNVMATAAGWAWHDFEDACTGPAAWDLAPSVASPFMDTGRFLAAYGGTADARLLDVCQQLRRLHLTVWYSLYAERLPECRPRAAELLAGWPAP